MNCVLFRDAGTYLAKKSSACLLDHGKNEIEQGGIRIIRVWHLKRPGGVRVEAHEKLHLGPVDVIVRPGAKDALVASVESHHEVEILEPVRVELLRSVVCAVKTSRP